MLFLGNCLEQLKTLPDNSVDSIVTDPPYGLSFMGKAWDYDVPKTEVWIEALRVLKPGSHLLAFFGTRTYHRGVVRIEDAGFEIRDQIMWIYGSGFPKSTDVSKRIDKEAGAKREIVGKYISPEGTTGTKSKDDGFGFGMGDMDKRIITAASTDEAKQWQGWGTALKPANEPIVVARKPLEKGLTVAQNVLKWGTGALDIDGSRIGECGGKPNVIGTTDYQDKTDKNGSAKFRTKNVIHDDAIKGRWPANILFDEEAAALLDEQTKDQRASKPSATGGRFKATGAFPIDSIPVKHDDSGGASRFFYVAKASKSERNAGLERMPQKESTQRFNASLERHEVGREPTARAKQVKNQNHHPTVKPIKLMQYLINLVTPPNGSVLDPFMGSGSTGIAAKNLNRKFIGIELNEEYFKIAVKRIS